jgi:hypothetical protein
VFAKLIDINISWSVPNFIRIDGWFIGVCLISLHRVCP